MSAHPDPLHQRCSFWRRWSPWTLRARVRAAMGAIERTNSTDDEQQYRYLLATLRGMEDPGAYCERFSVKGMTLCIDATRPRSEPARVGIEQQDTQ